VTVRGLVAAIDFCIYTRNAALQTMRDRRQKMVSHFFYAPNVSLFLCVDVIERHESSVSFYFLRNQLLAFNDSLKEMFHSVMTGQRILFTCIVFEYTFWKCDCWPALTVVAVSRCEDAPISCRNGLCNDLD